jgi:hypothetical protein
MSNWIPNLAGRTDPIVEQAIRYLFQAVYHLRDTGELSSAAKKTITNLAAGVPPTATVIEHIATQLSAGGSNPINVTGLPGTLPTPQTSSGPPIVTSLPGPADPLSFIGSLVIYQGIEYQYRAIPGGGNGWVVTVSVGAALSGALATFRTDFPAANYPPGTSIRLTEGPSFIIQDVLGVHHWLYYSGYQGDLLANIPTASLVLDDAGYEFSATDYIQQYVWNGTQFHFGPSSGSGYTQFFQNPPPTYGLWGVANGSNYLTSQDDGTIVSQASPTLPAGNYYRR